MYLRITTTRKEQQKKKKKQKKPTELQNAKVEVEIYKGNKCD